MLEPFPEPPSPGLVSFTGITFSPSDEARDVAVASNIVLTFSSAIHRGSGSITLKTGTGVTIATYDAASSTNLSISGSTLTINPSADLAYSTGYMVEFAVGSIKDLFGTAYAGTTSYNFTTAAAQRTGQTINGTIGNDTIDGGTDIDTAVFSVARASYVITRAGATITVHSPPRWRTAD